MNTISTKTYRDKYRLANLDTLLRSALVTEKICMVDRTGAKTIQSPYGSQPTTTVQAIAGTYSVASYTTTDDTLTVADEFIVAEHIFDFEQTLTQFDVFSSRLNEQQFSVANIIDKWVLNNLTEDGTGSYTTPVGGFTTASNVNTIMANLLTKVAGYSEAYNGLYLVIESTDVVGFVLSGASSGFSFADSVLKNGLMTSYMGVDIYVVRSGIFVDETTSTVSGTKTWTNLNHRVFGVKNITTFAYPQGVKFEEKMVTGKTGMEVVTYGYMGFKAWYPKLALTVDITLA
jgi:hypothetical protein